jgi:parallel beta-helix repeat protein
MTASSTNRRTLAVVTSLLVVSAFGFGALTVQPAAAQEAVTSCRTLDTPGEYVLGADITGATGNCIVITANRVAFDGNGHRIEGTGAGSGIVLDAGVADASVRDVVVAGFASGVIGRPDSSGNVVERVRVSDVTDSGIFVRGPGYTLTENRVSDADNGIRLLTADGSVLTDNVATGNVNGFRVQFTAASLRLTGNDATGNSGAGFLVDSDSNRFVDTVANDNGDGIVLTGARNSLVRTTADGNAGDGVRLGGRDHDLIEATTDGNRHGVVVRSAGSTLAYGSATDNAVGIVFEDRRSDSVRDNAVLHYTVEESTVGVSLRGNNSRNVFVDNEVRNSSEFGVLVDDDSDENSFSDTVVEGATEGVTFADGSDSNRFTNNVVRGVEGAGVWVVSSSGNVVEGNAVEEASAGVFVQRGTQNTVAGNQFTDVEEGVVVRGGSLHRVLRNDVSGVDLSGVVVAGSRSPLVDGNRVDGADTGIRVTGSQSVRVVGNTVTGNGVGIAASDVSSVYVGDNAVEENTFAGIVVSAADTPSVVDNRVLRNARGVVTSFDVAELSFAGNLVRDNDDVGLLVGRTDGRVDGNEFRDNRVGLRVGESGESDVTLRGNTFAGNDAFGVDNRGPSRVDARFNYWGAADGPSSPADPDAPFADPVTGTPADGSGDAVSEGSTPGVSNVWFEGFRSAA